jgi:hypothetical protein
MRPRVAVARVVPNLGAEHERSIALALRVAANNKREGGLVVLDDLVVEGQVNVRGYTLIRRLRFVES